MAWGHALCISVFSDTVALGLVCMTAPGTYAVPGTIYVLHFDSPFHHARHYVGWTEGLVERRIDDHLKGVGSPLVKAVVEAGISVQLACTWSGTRFDERRIKNRKKTSKLCPLCRCSS